MKLDKAKLIKQLDKENVNRWFGKPEYSCLTCSHSMSKDGHQLVCVENENHKDVENEHLCKAWN
ncbi:hypothetical protein ACTFR9_26755 [Bacillus cereus group sp. MYBK222-1]|uniref:hypothetical protein n=1 Tax=Bacillus cereus group sp. MYBK222-1 TaxID=3450659 RepID=UPI003F7B050A